MSGNKANIPVGLVLKGLGRLYQFQSHFLNEILLCVPIHFRHLKIEVQRRSVVLSKKNDARVRFEGERYADLQHDAEITACQVSYEKVAGENMPYDFIRDDNGPRRNIIDAMKPSEVTTFSIELFVSDSMNPIQQLSDSGLWISTAITKWHRHER